jgi:hypothetical protein
VEYILILTLCLKIKLVLLNVRIYFNTLVVVYAFLPRVDSILLRKSVTIPNKQLRH